MSLGIRVKASEAENARRRLRELGLMDSARGVLKDAGDVIFPLTAVPTEELGILVDVDFDAVPQRGGSYLERLDLPVEAMACLPRAFDVVGDIAILRIGDDAAGYAALVGQAVAESNSSVRLVLWDRGVKGELRVRELERLWGSGSTETVHQEHGCRFAVDVARVYFSPRLATERQRVAAMVGEGENILDMFAGVGPFAVIIARHHSPAGVDAVDLNPAAIGYMERNVAMNKVAGVVRCHLGDGGEFAMRSEGMDRIIMNLPHTARGFLPQALHAAKAGATIHYYEICDREELDGAMSALEGVRAHGRRAEAVGVREVRNYSPSSAHFAIDLEVSGP